MTSPYNAYNVKREMKVVDFEWPALTEYDLTQANQQPVEVTPIQLGYKIEKLENDLAFEKESLRIARNEICDWEVKFKNLEFANKNLQFQVDKIPTLKRTIRYMMAEHLDIELGDK